jgi:Cu-processing system permease protein
MIRAVAVIAGKEIAESLRSRWVLAATLLLAVLSLSLTFLGAAPTGSVGASPLDVVVVSLSSLTVFLVPLIALLIAHDAIVGEAERGTLLLLLTYPVSRPTVVMGKFIGHLAVLGFATIIGYGAAVTALMLTGAPLQREGLTAFAVLVGSSILLGAVFVALGYLISARARDRGTAAGVAIGVWLTFVLVYDMALLGVLVADQGRVLSGAAVNVLLLFNPTDAYRMLNLAGSSAARAVSGMVGATGGADLGPGVLLPVLVGWVAIPLILASLIFSRREL